ncbi:MFS transporter [Sphaerisporangium aureirubrum]|uniref:MFS transporter n=1 Tax=Sphaerisporangium aureirubrum TaxID=1544736 RepID=A0ABW1NGZ7_9ACTN
MTSTLALARSFDRPVRLLLVNQLTINIGFYMLMPYLAGHLSGALGLSAAVVGLILGVRNLGQQGMFLIGGTLADRFGYKPAIVAGCALRTAGFLLLGLAGTVPVLIAASVLTGLAGALFNPAVRAYLAEEAGERRVEAFAAFNAFYQLGILAGPLIGFLLYKVDFSAVCLTAALMFAALTVAQLRALPPQRTSTHRTGRPFLADWSEALSNRNFMLFAGAMSGSYILNFQIYLTLPLEIRRTTGGELGVTLMFVLSGLLTIATQAHVTSWATRRWTPPAAVTRGLFLMSAAFLPLALTAPFLPPTGPVPPMIPIMLTTTLLTLATMLAYPFEMATIITLAGDRMIATYYGIYNTLAGLGIATGTLLSGLTLDIAHHSSLPSLPWTALTLIGTTCALALHLLSRKNRLTGTPHEADLQT